MEKQFINKTKLREIRNNCDWMKIIENFWLEIDHKKSNGKDVFIKCPWTLEKTASLHINLETWAWYNFSSSWSSENWWPIEFVQVLMRNDTGQILNCYEVWRVLLQKGVSCLGNSESISYTHLLKPHHKLHYPDRKVLERKKEVDKRNPVISQNLLPLLTEKGTHQEFLHRWISYKTCEYLGCGFLSQEKWQLSKRIVFQVRWFDEKASKPVVLTHIGRATTKNQEEEGGKWRHYAGFHKSLELYNFDKLFTDSLAIKQAKKTGHVIIVEGCFDVAKLVEAGIFNVVASFGAGLGVDQIPRVQMITKHLGVDRFLVWYDRDQNLAGAKGQSEALKLLKAHWFHATGFDWKHKFFSPARGKVGIPDTIGDVCDFSVEALGWLRRRGVV